MELDNGFEANVGNCCGRKAFPEFGRLKNEFESRKRVRNYRERLILFKNSLNLLYGRLDEIKKREHGASWLGKTRENFRQDCPSDLMQQLRARAQRGESDVYVERTMTNEEAALRSVMSQRENRKNEDVASFPQPNRVQYVRESIGRIRGLDIWKKDIRTLLIEGIELRANEFFTEDIYQLPEAKLRTWVKWIDGLEASINEIEILLADGMAFFDESNINLVLQLPLSSPARQEVSRLQWDTKRSCWKKKHR